MSLYFPHSSLSSISNCFNVNAEDLNAAVTISFNVSTCIVEILSMNLYAESFNTASNNVLSKGWAVFSGALKYSS